MWLELSSNPVPCMRRQGYIAWCLRFRGQVKWRTQSYAGYGGFTLHNDTPGFASHITLSMVTYFSLMGRSVYVTMSWHVPVTSDSCQVFAYVIHNNWSAFAIWPQTCCAKQWLTYTSTCWAHHVTHGAWGCWVKGGCWTCLMVLMTENGWLYAEQPNVKMFIPSL